MWKLTHVKILFYSQKRVILHLTTNLKVNNSSVIHLKFALCPWSMTFSVFVVAKLYSCFCVLVQDMRGIIVSSRWMSVWARPAWTEANVSIRSAALSASAQQVGTPSAVLVHSPDSFLPTEPVFKN